MSRSLGGAPKRGLIVVAAVLAVAVGVVSTLPAVGSELAVQPPLSAEEAAASNDAAKEFHVAEPGAPVARPPGLTPTSTARRIAKAYLGHEVGAGSEVTAVEGSSVRPSAAGGTTVKLQQTQGGIPVLGAQAMVDLDAAGNIRASSVETLSRPPKAAAEVSATQAQTLAIASVAKSQGVPRKALVADPGRKTIYDPRVVSNVDVDRSRLAWSVDVASRTGSEIDRLVVVDAETGAILLSYSHDHAALNRAVCDAQNDRGQAAEAVPCATPNRAEGGVATSVDDVDNAYEFLGDAYAYLSSNLGIDSFDNEGSALRAAVRFCPPTSFQGSCPYANAFWDTSESQVVLGDGYGKADDIVAHELFHGVTGHMSELVYFQQSGAINEALSDIFGEMVDQSNETDYNAGDWLIGEDLPNGPIRSLANPTDFGDPDRTGSGFWYEGNLDAGGVHTNSGVANKFAYLLAHGDTFNGETVQGIGNAKASKVIFQAANLLTSASDYGRFALALESACNTLTGSHGITAGDCAQVDAAIAATQMAAVPTNAIPSQAQTCPVNRTAVDVWTDGFESTTSGKWVESGGAAWNYGSQANAVRPATGTNQMWGADLGQLSDSRLTTAARIAIPANAYLRFDHAYSFEASQGDYWDGGVIEYSTDNGASWIDAGALIDSGATYGGSVGSANAMGERAAFVGTSVGFNYTSSRLDLSTLAGQNAEFRFRIGTDADVAAPGWFIDDVALYRCTSGLATGLAPVIAEAIGTADGFTAQITNFDSSFTWTASASPPIAAAISQTGLLTVTGLDPSTSATVSVGTSKDGYAAGSVDVAGTSSVGSALTPAFGPMTSTASSFGVTVLNYDPAFSWDVSATAGGNAAISNSGVITVTGLAPLTNSTVSVTTTRSGYASGTANFSGSTTAAPTLPTAPPPTPVTAPAKLAKPAVKRTGKRKVNVRWTPSQATGPVRYVLVIKVGKSVLRVAVAGSAWRGKLPAKFAGRAGRFQVQAINSAGTGPFSSAAKFVIR